MKKINNFSYDICRCQNFFVSLQSISKTSRSVLPMKREKRRPPKRERTYNEFEKQ